MKNKRLRFKNLTLAMLLLLSASAGIKAQVVHNEGFEGTQYLPTGWSAVSTYNFWTRKSTNFTFPNCAPHTGVATTRFNSHTAGADTTQTIVSPVVDYSARGTADAPFSFWIYRDAALATNYDSLQILFNTTPTLAGAIQLGTIARSALIAIPDTHTVSGWYQYTFLAPQGYSSATNYFLLKGTSKQGNSMYIDDISWTSFPNQCDGTQQAGTLSSVLTTICNGGGTTSLSVAGQTTGYDGLSLQWQSTNDTTALWSNVGTGATTLSTGNISQTTYYRIIAGCSFAVGADTSAIQTIVVSANPTPSLASTPTAPAYCNGATEPTAVTVSGALSYSWSPATGLNTTSGEVVLASPTASTQYTVIGTDDVGCQGTLTVNVIVANAPNFTMSATPAIICEGDSTRIRASVQGGGGGGSQYAWATGQTTSNFYDHPLTNTTYYCTVTNTAGCSKTDSITATVLPAMVSGFDFVSNGMSYTFTNTSVGDTSSLWMFGDGNGSFVRNPVYTFNDSGTVVVQLISFGPCGSDTVSQVLTILLPNGISTIDEASISLMPNPTHQNSTLSFPAGSTQSCMRIFSTVGQVVLQKTLTTQAGRKFTENIDLSAWPSGIYIVRLETGNQSFTRRIVKE